ncbi:MAG TPA: D-glycerate dehydrogenase [Thermoleophilaceae bacterium]|nr:D-glycerate dehydrogenase [Thermoleophilaceae bacterium]
MARCFVTRRIPGSALDRLAVEHELEVWEERLPPTPAALRDRVADAEGLLCMLTDPVDRELIEAAPALRAISTYAVGTDNIDLDAASGRGIPVGHTPDVLTETSADLTLALMLAVMRRISEGDASVRAGDWLTWEPAMLLGHDLHRATVGIVGLGRIGRAVKRRVEGFGARVLHNGRTDGVPLDQLLEESTVVTLHCPLTEQTHGLIDAAALRRMRADAYLVNTARGPIVDTDALRPALEEGWIAGAALDVTDPEPLPADHPLLGAPNLVVAPHLGSASHETRAEMADIAVDNLLAGLRGEPMPHCANPAADGSHR